MSRAQVVVVDLELGQLVVGRRVVEVVAGQVGQQRLHVVDRVGLVGAHVVGDTALGVVRPRAAELLELHVLAGDRLDDVRTGDEHVRGLVDHHGEVGDGGGVDGAAGARPHDQRDLRDDARGQHVAPEDLAVEPEGDDALLDARAAGVVDADHRDAGLERQVHDLDDLLAEDLAEGPAEDGEVLREDADLATVDGAVAGDDAVAVRPPLGDAEGCRAVPGQRVGLDEGALVEQGVDALASGLLAARVLRVDGLGRAGVAGLVHLVAQLRQLARGRVEVGQFQRFGGHGAPRDGQGSAGA